MNLDKVKLITSREYWTRVKKKTFLISTILTPLSIVAIAALSGYMSSGAVSKAVNVIVKDESNLVRDRIRSSKSMSFEFSQAPVSELSTMVEDGRYDYAVIIPEVEDSTVVNEYETTIIGLDKPGFGALERLQGRLEKATKKYNIIQSGYTEAELDKLEAKVKFDIEVLKEGEGEDVSNASIAIGSAVGGIMGFIMYIVLLVYGSFVMRSVMEEKINRIVEVVISSVKPFELMLGKILGVGLVGLTQIFVWIVLIGIGMMILTAVFGVSSVDPSQMATAMDMVEEVQTQSDDGFSISKFLTDIKEINWPLITICFAIFFFGGFFIYASLFAAVGSAIGDDMTEGQSLTFPIMIPIIASIIMLMPMINEPNGPLAIFGSIFPLTSPLLMPARAAFDPPIWQVIISIALLIASCIFFVWLSGKIYRAGILLYGKKLSFKNLFQIIKN